MKRYKGQNLCQMGKKAMKPLKECFFRTRSIDHFSDLIQSVSESRSFCILSDIEDNFKTLHLSFIAFF